MLTAGPVAALAAYALEMGRGSTQDKPGGLAHACSVAGSTPATVPLNLVSMRGPEVQPVILIRVLSVDVPVASSTHRPAHEGGTYAAIRRYYLAGAPPATNNHCAHYGPHYHHYCYCYDYLTNFHDYRLPFSDLSWAVIAALVSAALLVPMMLATDLPPGRRLGKVMPPSGHMTARTSGPLWGRRCVCAHSYVLMAFSTQLSRRLAKLML